VCDVAELVIRNGLVVDGTGSPPAVGDVAVDGGRIVALGPPGAVDGRGRREIDAEGRVVAPGWVDVHTHYDGQATWDGLLTPSSWHGVTTTVFGNCSVGFAPVRPGTQNFLINLMEGVEDIPGTVLAEGIDFRWETFDEYLDALDATERVMDVGAQVPHAALRFYVMGERGADHAEAATPGEIAEMGRLTAQAIRAGAVGFTTSRTTKHRARDGRFTPSLTAGDAELLGIAEAVGTTGRGVLQCNSDFGDDHELEILRRMAETSGRPLSFSLIQVDSAPDRWRELLAGVAAANQAGVPLRVQVGARPIGVIFGLEATLNPFMMHPTYRKLAGLPLAERVAEMRRPEVRDALLAERPEGGFAAFLARAMARTFELGDPPDYEPPPAASLAARAAAEGRSPWALLYDLVLADDGHALLYHPFENYSGGDLEPVAEMLRSPHAIAGLGDGGAHVGTICDASFPTTLLTHWVRDRTRGERLPLELVVKRQCADTARAMGFADRGVLAPGLRADINVIDLDGLHLHPPQMVHDLPAGGKRLVQRVDGYRHTFVAGVETYADGEWTGATPGRLVRGTSRDRGAVLPS
jgi:N-acyl-D-aspartate/D-glutamate deacylase